MRMKQIAKRALSTAVALVFALALAAPALAPVSKAETVSGAAMTKPAIEVDRDLLYRQSEVLDDFSDPSLWEADWPRRRW